MQRVAISGGLFMAALTAALVVGTPRLARAQDAEQIKKGEQVYAAQKCSVCHSIAGKGGKQNPLDGVGSKLSADDIRQVDRRSGRDGQEGELHQETADAEEVRQASAGELDALVAYMQSLKK